MQILARLALVACCGVTAGAAAAQEDVPMKLLTQFTGGARCLDIVNDARRDRLVMADCGNYSGQAWILTQERGTPFGRWQNSFSGPGQCLDVINDGTNNRVHMAPCGNYSGQFWDVQPARGGNDAVQMTNTFTGPDRCLDIVNDGANDTLTIADCGNYSGQMWVLHAIE